MTKSQFLKSKDFMKLGQAIDHGIWQVAGMTAARMQKEAAAAGIHDFDRQLINMKQCIAGRKKSEALNVLASMVSKRVQMLKNIEKDARIPLIVVAGTNASGKSGLGIELACHYGAEIVSADSRQVFKGLDLGSGKVTKDEMKGIPHHLLDVAEPNDFFSLSTYQNLAYAAIDDIASRQKTPFLVGGTGLYVNAVVDGYNLNSAQPDPETRARVEAMSLEEILEFIRKEAPSVLERVDVKNKRRLERAAEKIISGDFAENPSSPRYDSLIIGVTWPREILYERIRERLTRRLSEGMIDEVRTLRENGATDDFLYKLGLEYRYILMYLRGEFADYDAFYDKLFMEIRHLAKEQMTWFRKRKDIHWIDMQSHPFEESCELIDKFLENY